MQKREKFLWLLFGVDIILGIIMTVSSKFHLAIGSSAIFYLITASIPVLLLILHSIWTLNLNRGLLLALLAALTGLLFEIDGLKYGAFFGGQYSYHFTTPTLFEVPIFVVLYWAVFIYTGYSITNSFLFWLNKKKPTKDNNGFALMLFLILVDGIIVTSIDIFMDPILSKAGAWTWLHGGPFFGVPTGNFVGWFIVTAVATSIFRLFEYLFPQTSTTGIKKSVFLIPLLGYIVLALFFTASALQYHLTPVIIIGLTLMGGISIANLILYLKKYSAVNTIS